MNDWQDGDVRVAGTNQGPSGAGRWPANLVLSHAEGCAPAGPRRVRSAWGQSTRGRDHTGHDYGAGHGLARSEIGQTVGHADADGMETVEAWECVEGCAVAELDRQSGVRPAGSPINGGKPSITGTYEGGERVRSAWAGHGDTGGASRFFYVAKASARERSAGLPPGQRNTHRTVKPIELMRYLCRLVTPVGGVVLDPFMGSGTTGIAAILEGFGFIGIEEDEASVRTAIARLQHWRHEPDLLLKLSDDRRPSDQAQVQTV